MNLTIELTNEEILFLAIEAHKRDMTLNNFIIELLKEALRDKR